MATQKESYDQTPEAHLKSDSTGAGSYRSPFIKTGGQWLGAYEFARCLCPMQYILCSPISAQKKMKVNNLHKELHMVFTFSILQ